MVRTLTSNAKAVLSNNTQNEPITIIAITWVNGTVVKYADKDLPGIQGKILEISPIDDVLKLSKENATSSSFTVKLDDTDGTIKALMDTIDIHKRPVVVYQCFQGMDVSDAFELYAGEIVTPIIWKEGDDNESGRTVQFDVLTPLVGNQTSFTPEQGQFPGIPIDLLGQTWPMGFGDCVHVPGVKVNEEIASSTSGFFIIPDASLELKLGILATRLTNLAQSINYFFIKAAYVNQVSSAPEDILSQYCSMISSEDSAKQNLEDSQTQLQGLREQIDALRAKQSEAVGGDGADYAGQISAAQEQLTSAFEDVRVQSESLYEALYAKQTVEIDAMNAEYQYQVIAQIRQQISSLLGEYQNYYNQYTLIQQTITRQNSLVNNTVGVINASLLNFPQGVSTQVFIDGIRCNGTFQGNTFIISEILPKYTDVQIADRQDNGTNLSAFWIQDPTLSLKGCYCLMSSGFVFQVTDQAGTECTLTPIPRKYINIPYNPNGPQLIPFSSSLSDSTVAQLNGAQEYTTNEQTRIIQDAISQSPDSGDLQQIQDNISSLMTAASGAIDENAANYQSAIQSNLSLYNDVISRINIPQSAIDQANVLISQHEFDILYRMERLQEAILVRDSTPLIADPNIHNNNLNNPYQYIFSGLNVTGEIKEVSPVILPGWVPKSIPNLSNWGVVHNLPNNPITYFPSSPMFVSRPGSSIVLAANFQEKFIVNILPSQVVAVYAYQSLDIGKVLTPVPSSYYTVNSNDIYGRITATSVSMLRPLSQYATGWDDQIYVSYTSPVGPNTVDIIEWLLQTYATSLFLSDDIYGSYVTQQLGIDDVSFAYVRAKVDPFPSSFCVFEQKNVLDLVADIAWQARCAVFYKDRIAYITYLAEIPPAIATFNESNVEEGSLEMSLTETENLVTKLVAKWQQDYAHPQKVSTTVRYNINKYGTLEQDYDFFIYNQYPMILKAATFWTIRKANSFKHLRFKTFINNLQLETFDAILIAFNNGFFSNTPVTALIDNTTYNSDDDSITIECWLPVRAGEMTQYPYVWPANLPVQTIYPTILEMTGGYAGDIFNTLIPTGSEFALDLTSGTPISLQVQFRPADYGEIFISDQDFQTPSTPLGNLSQIAYSDTTAAQATYDMPLGDLIYDYGTGTYSSSGGGGSLNSVKGGSPKNSSANVQVTEKNEAGTFPHFGRVLGQDTSSDSKNMYTVELTDGRQVPCRQIQISPKSIIPEDTMTLVLYNPNSNEYNMQVPVWLDDTASDSSSTQNSNGSSQDFNSGDGGTVDLGSLGD